MQSLNRLAVTQLLPHGARMCLLDSVEAWDDAHIECRTETHRQADNPLRDQAMLPGICGLEYAAQAMALHCALTQGRHSASRGYLAAVRSLALFVARLDTINSPLQVQAQRLLSERAGAIYAFEIAAGGRPLLRGQVSVFLQQTEAAP